MNLLAQIHTAGVDYAGLKVMLPLSGGINSAALLCWLGEMVPADRHPLELHLSYSHFEEHSPDTHQFVVDLIMYANRTFKCEVNSKIHWNSVNRYFVEQKMIPHPTLSPCSKDLKVLPRRKYFETHGLDVELIGYVKSDLVPHGGKKSRFQRLTEKSAVTQFPILEWSKRECLDFVKSVIGWYPAIYDIKDESGRDVFSHNNCLPCKNMSTKQLQNVGRYFPQYARRAEQTAEQIPGGYWGRDDVPEVFACDVCERMG